MEELKKIKLSKNQMKELLNFMRLLKEELNVSEIYIFGSRVYGIPLKDSDLDMLIISDKFKERSFIENMEILSKLWNGSFTIEMFPYYPEQLKKYKGKKIVITEALEKGIRIDLKNL
ncbi:MAG: nucleotidyltransferase domain-containing protein [Candidatus Methanomethyliaceae archaeon]|nr:nucleotidyltransferase domain-containing protein [Candidatus Methanomethyliaceae archaeon]